MMKFRLGIGHIGGAAAVALGLSVGGPAQAASFSFTQISENTPGLQRFRGAAINDQGRVAYEGFRPLPPGAPPTAINPPAAIFAGDGGAVQPVSGNFPNLYNTTFNASINNADAVTFTGNRLDFSTLPPGFQSAGIFANTGTLPPNQVATTSPGGFRFFGSSDINDAGTVAFVAGVNPLNASLPPFAPGPVGVFTFTPTVNGGAINPVATTAPLGLFSNFNRGIDLIGGNDPFTVYTAPSINNSGAIAFTAGLNASGPGIFVSGANGLTTIADASQFNAFGTPAINNPGTVAFVADTTGGSRGIFTGNGAGGVSELVSTNGAFQAFLSDPAINDRGNVAFFGQLDTGDSGIYLLRDNSLLHRVIGIGDSLLGQTITGLTLTNRGLNNRNEIAFSALFADGSEQVFSAQEVPEPASIAGLGAVACGILLKRKQRKKVAQ